MRTFRTAKARGFTLVELMIVVAIIGVLAALAIYGVRRYLATAKSAEAKNTIGAINRGAVGAYERESVGSEIITEGSTGAQANHALCTSATAPVPATTQKGVKYQPDTKDNADFNTGSGTAGWKCLRFSMNEAIYYQYNYTRGAGWASPTGAPAPGANGWESGAKGDLDGDAVLSLFASGGQVNTATGEVKVFTHVAEENPDE